MYALQGAQCFIKLHYSIYQKVVNYVKKIALQRHVFFCLFSPAAATLKKALTAHRASGAGGQRGQSAQREHGVCSCVPGRPSNLARQ